MYFSRVDDPMVARKKSYTRFKLFRLAPPPHSATVLFMKTRHHSRPTCCGNGWTIFRWIFRNYQKISFKVSIVGEARRWFAFAYRENGTLQKLSATRSRFNRLIFLSSCNKKFSAFLHVTKQKEKRKNRRNKEEEKRITDTSDERAEEEVII